MPTATTLRQCGALIALGSALWLGPAPSLAAGPAEREQVRQWSQQAFEAYERAEVERAVSLYDKAARAGDAQAHYNLAVMRIREESQRPTLAQAIAHLRISAEAGFAPAQHMFGSLLDTGQLVAQDKERATRMFAAAAAQGHADAALELALQYYLGRGIAQDYALAARWYEVAARAGDAAAQYILASMYETALGVTRDLDAALDWYNAAARQGDVAARLKARAITERLARDRGS